MITALAFYLIFYPLSLLPLWMLYGISYLFYLVIHYVIRYRRKIITDNLRKAFPEKSEREIVRLRRKYYLHLAQIAAEMLKMLTLSKRQVMRRYRCENPELVRRFHEEGRSVILMSSHYNDWEWMILSLPLQYPHQAVGVGKANSNKMFEKLINRARTRNGTRVVFADHVRELFCEREENRILSAYMMLSDQSPNHISKSYKTLFLNQPTGVIYGAEYFARKYNIPVLYYEVIKDRIGHYRIINHIITEDPTATSPGEITERYVRLLEKTIRRQPAYWLWSHRRWKHSVSIDEIQHQQ
ncbi:MAG: lysophospholipid acyltransferase family protein [Bacteroidales bacterium]|nr:lysophospholipid acyltransferase family protein [Bacteroidales bacterium]